MNNISSIPQSKVTVICTVYNHENFLSEALDSIRNQDYPNIELIVIDNGSNDGSRAKIDGWAKVNRDAQPILIFRDKPINYCASFNEALYISTGAFVIDLSGDDILLQGHIEASLSALKRYPSAVASFSDAEIAERDVIKRFYEANKHGPPTLSVGDVYVDVIAKYCISTVTLVFRADELKAIGGYDESLVYEDFDIICRLARKFHFCYSPHIGVRKLITKTSLSSTQYKSHNSPMLESTLQICKRIKQMNLSEEENQALYKRTMYEAFHALGSANFKVARGFLELSSEMNSRSIKIRVYQLWQKSGLNLSALYQKLR